MIPPLLAALALALPSAPPPLEVEVFVPLCDARLIACGRGAAGDPDSLEGNLYWGAAYGAERFLSRAAGFAVQERKDLPAPDRPHLLREVRLVRRPGPGERQVRLRLLAYAGGSIDQALAEFLAAAGGASGADLVVWAGHDRLMDVPAPAVSRSASARPAVVLACSSRQYFGPVLDALGARPLALTRSFMAPEAYLLEALAGAVARHGVEPAAAVPVRQALIQAYARYQKISERAAATVFEPLRERGVASPGPSP